MGPKLSFPGQQSFTVKKISNRNFANIDGPILTPPNPTDINPNGTPKDDGGVVINPPILPVLPVFPDFTIMTCTELAQSIKQLTETYNAESLVVKNPDWLTAYQNAINSATALYNSKGCAVTPAPDPKLPPVVINNNPPPILSGLPGGGIVGGSGSGASTPTTTSTPKKSFPWLWVVIGGIALLMFSSDEKAS